MITSYGLYRGQCKRRCKLTEDPKRELEFIQSLGARTRRIPDRGNGMKNTWSQLWEWKSHSGSKMILWSSRLKLEAVSMRLANRLVPDGRQNCVPESRRPGEAIKDILEGKDISFILKSASPASAISCSCYSIFSFTSNPEKPSLLSNSVFSYVCTTYSWSLTTYLPHSAETPLLHICTWNPFYLSIHDILFNTLISYMRELSPVKCIWPIQGYSALCVKSGPQTRPVDCFLDFCVCTRVPLFAFTLLHAQDQFHWSIGTLRET